MNQQIERMFLKQICANFISLLSELKQKYKVKNNKCHSCLFSKHFHTITEKRLLS